MSIDMATITEDEAIRLYHDMATKFGWRGSFFTREDAENSYNEYHGKEGAMTDETWEKVLLSWYWRKGLEEIMTERGWDLVHDAVAEAMEPAT